MEGEEGNTDQFLRAVLSSKNAKPALRREDSTRDTPSTSGAGNNEIIANASLATA